MFKKDLTAVVVFLSAFTMAHAQTTYSGDTIFVQAFTYGSAQDSGIVFPSDTIRFEKIMMRYRLRCPYTVQCGEWDYLTYSYLYRPTGKLDSVKHVVPSYVVNGISPDSLAIIHQPTYSYTTHFDYAVNYTNVISFDSTLIGNGTATSKHPFQTALPTGRSQYLWKAADLIAAGLTAGDLTGMQFNFTTIAGDLKNVVIRLKHTSLDSVTNINFESKGFTEVFHHSAGITNTGWQPFHFTNPFTWDGMSNIVVDISYTNANAGTDFEVAADNLNAAAGMASMSDDRSLYFYNKDYIDVPADGFASLDSAITISFWQYGNPLIQPQNDNLLEAVDSLNNRVLNIHLPWGNGSVYWDAGNNGNLYDRINKAAPDSLFEGKWNHWAFVKNAATSRMRMYVNGKQWHFIPGRTQLMKNIARFRIGSNINATGNYDGSIDDLEIFKGEVDSATIRKWMYRELDNTHPYFSNLLYNFKMDDTSLVQMTDASAGNYTGIKNGYPIPVIYKGNERFKNFTTVTYRPQVVFEQGVYTSTIDSVLVVDSLMNDPNQVLVYGDTLNPGTVTDTLITFPTAYIYTYDNLGNAIDSTLTAADSTLHLSTYTYYDAPYQVTDRFEIGRFITPYGNGLNLGNGFTWWYDVSDYRNLLHDTMRLVSGNWQELHDLQFVFIKGIPPRDPISIRNIWNGEFYQRASDSIETKHLFPKSVFIDSAAVNMRVKIRTTGHGEDNQNCAEFCVHNHTLKVDGITQWSQDVWKDDCGVNPLYPQGGTWVYQRANWCPGDDVPTWDFELTPFVNSGDSVQLDYDAAVYNSVGGSPAHWVVETQLVEYGAPNFTLDAAITEVRSPSDYDIYKRMNPICNNPIIVIKNTGTTILNSLAIAYGLVGGTPSTFTWSGNLNFLESEVVQLGQMNWNVPPGLFYATVSNPNGSTDQYANNNTMYSWFTTPPQYPSQLIFELKTNSEASQNSYAILDDQGTIVWSRSGLTNNTTYADTLTFNTGCYKFRLNDAGEDGLTWWANPAGGSGYMRIKNPNTSSVIKQFNSDFGKEIYQEFTVGYLLPTQEHGSEKFVAIYPNPVNNEANIDMSFDYARNINVTVYDATGKLIRDFQFSDVVSKTLKLDTKDMPAGIYLVKVKADDELFNKRFVIQR